MTAMAMTEGAAGQAQPYISSAAQYTQAATNPLWPQLPSYNVSGLPGQGFGAYGAAQGYAGGAANIAGGLQSQVAPYTGYGFGTAQQIPSAIAPYSSTSFGMGSALPTTLQPYASAATAPINVPSYNTLSTYFNPYTQNVVDTTQKQFANQNAQEQARITGNAASQGALGGDREAVAQGIAAGQEQLAQAPVIAGLYSSGFTGAQAELNAQQQLEYNRQLSERQQALGAGNLISTGTGTGGNLLLGGGQLTSTGLTGAGYLGLGAGTQALQTGTGAGGLYLGAATPQIQTGAGYLGAYTGQQQAQLGALEANAWLNQGAGYGMGNLGLEAQNAALGGANALAASGLTQQNLAQEQLNIPFQQFQQQQAYPFQTAGWLTNEAVGIGSGFGGTSTTTYPAPSLLGQVAGAGIAGAGLLGATGAFGSNGWFPNLFGGGASPTTGPSFDTAPVTGATGGRIERRAAGGNVPGFAPGGIPLSLAAGSSAIPDVSVSIVPPPPPVGSHPSLLASNTGTTTTTDPGSSGILGALGPISSALSIGKFFAHEGGAVPGFGIGGDAEFQKGGAPYQHLFNAIQSGNADPAQVARMGHLLGTGKATMTLDPSFAAIHPSTHLMTDVVGAGSANPQELQRAANLVAHNRATLGLPPSATPAGPPPPAPGTQTLPQLGAIPSPNVAMPPTAGGFTAGASPGFNAPSAMPYGFGSPGSIQPGGIAPYIPPSQLSLGPLATNPSLIQPTAFYAPQWNKMGYPLPMIATGPGYHAPPLSLPMSGGIFQRGPQPAAPTSTTTPTNSTGTPGLGTTTNAPLDLTSPAAMPPTFNIGSWRGGGLQAGGLASIPDVSASPISDYAQIPHRNTLPQPPAMQPPQDPLQAGLGMLGEAGSLKKLFTKSSESDAAGGAVMPEDSFGGFQMGGLTAGALNSGDVSPASPALSSLVQRYRQVPPEKLREMLLSPQPLSPIPGQQTLARQAIQIALRQSMMSPPQTDPSAAVQGATAVPMVQAPQPGMTGYQEGGEVGEKDLPPADTLPTWSGVGDVLRSGIDTIYGPPEGGFTATPAIAVPKPWPQSFGRNANASADAALALLKRGAQLGTKAEETGSAFAPVESQDSTASLPTSEKSVAAAGEIGEKPTDTVPSPPPEKPAPPPVSTSGGLSPIPAAQAAETPARPTQPLGGDLGVLPPERTAALTPEAATTEPAKGSLDTVTDRIFAAEGTNGRNVLYGGTELRSTKGGYETPSGRIIRADPNNFGFPLWQGARGPTGEKTHAAGPGQWQPDTWKKAATLYEEQTGKTPNFADPTDQRNITKLWAQKRYKDLTGGDLAEDASNDKVNYAALGSEWTGLLRGMPTARGATAAAGQSNAPVGAANAATAAEDRDAALHRQISELINRPAQIPAMPPPPPARTAPDNGASRWLPLVAAGFGMMASRSPYALGAIGEGGLAGVRVAEQQQQYAERAQERQQEAQWRQWTWSHLSADQQAQVTAKNQAIGFQAAELLMKADDLAAKGQVQASEVLKNMAEAKLATAKLQTAALGSGQPVPIQAADGTAHYAYPAITKGSDGQPVRTLTDTGVPVGARPSTTNLTAVAEERAIQRTKTQATQAANLGQPFNEDAAMARNRAAERAALGLPALVGAATAPTAAHPPIPAPLQSVQLRGWSPSKQQFYDVSGNAYDINGKPIQ